MSIPRTQSFLFTNPLCLCPCQNLPHSISTPSAHQLPQPWPFANSSPLNLEKIKDNKEGHPYL
ncbi:uncharacterized protein BDV14DRAFT_73418 [Aspergillus stella-maris]|uniref:uncharacterized protein n=1 Tax=Aspergillus stella-maris TaxID=1810926 RepID=UPI003CCDC639